MVSKLNRVYFIYACSTEEFVGPFLFSRVAMKGIGRYGEPRHDHWESDYARSSCAAPDCNEPLSMFFRHHCRRCGKLFCPKCVGGGLQRRLNQNAELNRRGVLCPVCYECYVDENGWFSGMCLFLDLGFNCSVILQHADSGFF